MIDQLLLPFAFPFMQQAFAIALLVAAPMALTPSVRVVGLVEPRGRSN